MKTLRVLVLCKFGRLGASSRLRTLQYVPTLQECGFAIEVQELIPDEALQYRYRQGHYRKSDLLIAYWRRIRALLDRHSFDAVWIEKEALQWFPSWAELALLQGVPYILDYDDAVFHSYDRHPLGLVRCLYGRRLDRLMENSALVVAGNAYLAQRAERAGARAVEVIPTVVDLSHYPESPEAKSQVRDEAMRVVWIGSPSTVHYLGLIAEPLQVLAKKFSFVLRLIGGGDFSIPGVKTEVVAWTEATEAALLQECDIGVMPLEDTPWEQGKCGYKLIQYMASGLPVVASAVGANNEIVRHAETGYLVKSLEAWCACLETLLQNATLRQKMGEAGRARVVQQYCMTQTAPKLAGLIRAAAIGKRLCAE